MLGSNAPDQLPWTWILVFDTLTQKESGTIHSRILNTAEECRDHLARFYRNYEYREHAPYDPQQHGKNLSKIPCHNVNFNVVPEIINTEKTRRSLLITRKPLLLK